MHTARRYIAPLQLELKIHGEFSGGNHDKPPMFSVFLQSSLVPKAPFPLGSSPCSHDESHIFCLFPRSRIIHSDKPLIFYRMNLYYELL